MFPQINTEVHNRFDFEITDAVTGEVKQQVTSYNVVLDNYLRTIFESMGSDLTKYLHIGNGAGIPTPSRTTLFAELGTAELTTVSTTYAYPTTTRVKKVVIPPAKFVGTITEVGIGGTSNLLTHSMVVDSEGNPLTITKADTDILTIVSTIYITLNYNIDDALIVKPPASSNKIINAILDNNYQVLRYNIYTAAAIYPIGDLPILDKGYPNYFIKHFTISPEASGSYATLTFNMNTARTDYNNTGMNGFELFAVGWEDVVMWKMSPELFPPQTLSGLAIGTGDAVKTEFYMPIPECIDGTQKVYVDGVEKIAGVDYTFYNVNAKDFPSKLSGTQRRYLSSYKKKTIVSINEGGGPVFPKYLGAYQYYEIMSIATGHPIVFDFGEPTNVNYFAAPAITGQYQYWQSWDNQHYASLDYSTDNVNWTVFRENITQGDLINLTTPVVARYWRYRLSEQAVSLGLTDVEYGSGSNFGLGFGYVTPNIKFVTAPALNAVITMDADISRPFKNDKHIIDFSGKIVFSRG